MWFSVSRCTSCQMFNDTMQAAQFHFDNWQVAKSMVWGNASSRKEESLELERFSRELWELTPGGMKMRSDQAANREHARRLAAGDLDLIIRMGREGGSDVRQASEEAGLAVGTNCTGACTGNTSLW